MDDYVPYEERVRRERDGHRRSAASAATRHYAALDDVRQRLAGLCGRSTDVYVEVLRPVRGLRRRLSGPLIHLPVVTGGPSFVISEVVPAYRIRDASTSFGKDTYVPIVNDVIVTPDARVWLVSSHGVGASGRGVTHNTYQLSESASRELDSLGIDVLRNIVAALPG